MNGLQVFSYEGNEVRTVQKDDGTWWVLKDVCAVLDVSNNRDAALRLDEDEKDDVGITDAIGREKESLCPRRRSAHLLTQSLSRHPWVGFYDDFVVDVHHNGAMAERLHGEG